MNLLAKTTLSVAATSVALSTATILASAPAQALSFTVGGPLEVGPTTSWLGQPTSVINFPQNAVVPGTVTPLESTNSGLNGVASIQNLVGGDLNRYPLFTEGVDTGLELGLNTGTQSSVQLTFTKTLNFFGFFWAVPTQTDQVLFNFAGGGSQSFGLSSIPLNTGFFEGRYINFFTDPGERISSVVFSQSGFGAFQVRNVAYQATSPQVIPTPALLPGLLAIGVGLLRKRKSEASIEVEV